MFDVSLFVGLHIDVAFESLHSNGRLDLDGLHVKEGGEGGGEGEGEGKGRKGKGRGDVSLVNG